MGTDRVLLAFLFLNFSGGNSGTLSYNGNKLWALCFVPFMGVGGRVHMINNHGLAGGLLLDGLVKDQDC